MTDSCEKRSSFFISKRAISKQSTRLCFHRTAQSANTRSHDDEKAAKSDAKFKHFLTMESAGLMGTDGWEEEPTQRTHFRYGNIQYGCMRERTCECMREYVRACACMRPYTSFYVSLLNIGEKFSCAFAAVECGMWTQREHVWQ